MMAFHAPTQALAQHVSIQFYAQALNEDGEMIGERLRVLSRL
ncbi:DUF6530 family protein [Brevibacillus choshinensis]|nr:hypothetical protein [Brevibacillus choshinensis]